MRQKLLLACLGVLLLPKPGSPQSTLQSHTYRFEDLTSQKEANATFRPILDGMTRNGVHLHVHEVFLLPGSSPQHAHHHQQEEMFLVSEGEVQVTISGNTTKLGPGSAAFVAAGDQHQIANVGTRPAQYFEIILDPPAAH
ncbi:MAG TPA: cupin domain-containing protein [Candidatus Binatus sp.]|jgi:mannose-6-phosphate isomerase-like protein (cupin superfamily)|nr:cupin domain-containing protein [Candidatus Binatus sp.]